MTDKTPDGQQLEALRLMRQWYKDWKNGVVGTPQYFYLAGFAGTGKTFLSKFFLEEEGLSEYDVKLMTYMGRSALVLSKAAGMPASTVHSSIYKLVHTPQGEKWLLDHDSIVRNSKLIILDECSMIGVQMFRDIASFHRPILILGDPGQLQAFAEEPLFNQINPDYFLTEIRRQALDNPIIRFSQIVREGGEVPPGDHGKVKKLPAAEIPHDVFDDADTIITYKNASRDFFAQFFRQERGFDSPYPMKGDKLLCKKNHHGLGLANGQLGVATADVEPPFGNALAVQLSFQPDGVERVYEDLPVLKSSFVKTYDRFGVLLEDPKWAHSKFLRFEYGYAITCHVALGSQFDKIIIHDDWSMNDRARWFYTALTRAVDTCYIAA